MDENYKKKLIELGVESLANALVELSNQSNRVAEYLDILLASPQENIDGFKKKINSLKRSKRFVSRRDSTQYSQDLIEFLQKIKSVVHDPFTGIQLIGKFFEADYGILGHSDDSYGCIGDVFRIDATKMFVEYAKRCENKQKVADLVLKINQVNEFGIRDSLLDYAVDYLPETIIRSIIQKLQKQSNKKQDQYDYDPHSSLISSLARQIKDPKLFEESNSSFFKTIPSSVMIDIAQVYFESDKIEEALSRLQKVSDTNSFYSSQKEKLLKQIYKKKGDSKELSKLLLKNFENSPSEYSLRDLIEVIGEDQKHTIINTQTTIILDKSTLETSDISFLISIDKVDEAANHLLTLSDQLDGYYYDNLLPLAKTFESEDKLLASTTLYRALLKSILENAKTKAYPNGVRYLFKLDLLSTSIMDWKQLDSHHIFKEFIHQKHSRKRSFWSKYDKKIV